MQDIEEMWAYVKFAPPFNNTQYVQVSEIAASAGEVSLQIEPSKRQRIPYRPKGPDDFSKTLVYVMKTSVKSTDGKLHPYFCVIGRMGGKLCAR